VVGKGQQKHRERFDCDGTRGNHTRHNDAVEVIGTRQPAVIIKRNQPSIASPQFVGIVKLGDLLRDWRNKPRSTSWL